MSTITYAANGKQYICVMTGDNLKVPELSKEVPELRVPSGNNAIYTLRAAITRAANRRKI